MGVGGSTRTLTGAEASVKEGSPIKSSPTSGEGGGGVGGGGEGGEGVGVGWVVFFPDAYVLCETAYGP